MAKISKKPDIGGTAKFRLVLKRPWVSEKSLSMKGQQKYVFLVDNKANKKTAAQAVEKKYGVKVTAVNIVRLPAKTKRWRQSMTKGAGTKKAIVTLAVGQTIELV